MRMLTYFFTLYVIATSVKKEYIRHIITAFLIAHKGNYDYLLKIDGDGKQNPDILKRLLNELNNTNPHIQPSGSSGYARLSPNPIYQELLRKIKELGYNVWRNELVTQEEYEIKYRASIRPV